MPALDRLEGRIAQTFGATPAPSKREIAVGTDWDAEAITKAFGLFLKSPVTKEVLEVHAKSLPAFTPRAFVFFLKDYLRYAIRNPATELTEHLIYRLSSVKSADPYWAERLRLLSKEQRDVIAEWCGLVLEQLPEQEKVLRKHLRDAIQGWTGRTEST
jgi:hypothetical protein